MIKVSNLEKVLMWPCRMWLGVTSEVRLHRDMYRANVAACFHLQSRWDPERKKQGNLLQQVTRPRLERMGRQRSSRRALSIQAARHTVCTHAGISSTERVSLTTLSRIVHSTTKRAITPLIAQYDAGCAAQSISENRSKTVHPPVPTSKHHGNAYISMSITLTRLNMKISLD